jgi:antitoxin component YwqK of YwqJK toxin-antitoxin module
MEINPEKQQKKQFKSSHRTLTQAGPLSPKGQLTGYSGFYEDGSKLFEHTYRDGQTCSVTNYYRNGSKSNEHIFENGILTSLTNYLETGNVVQENLFQFGKCYYYASYSYNGKTVSRMNSIDQKGCFKREEYNDDGILTFKGECLDPKQKNPGAQFKENGICISQRSFENNEWNGKGTKYPKPNPNFFR